MVDDETFGIPKSALDSAREVHRGVESAGIHRIGSYLPTRADVFTVGAVELFVMLDIWFYESPVEIIPGADQVTEVLQVLKSRPDSCSEELLKSIQLCEQYLTSG